MYQQIQLIGNLGSDPELRYTPSGVAVANLNLAVNRTWKDQSGQQQTKTTWFRVAVWGKGAEPAAQYLKKGSQVFIVGEMEEARAFTDREGNSRASLEVKALTVKFLDSRGSNQAIEGGDSEPADSGSGSVPVEEIPF